MPPKTANADTTDGKIITVLCTLIMSCESFKAGTSNMAEVLGISHAKNVPRALNSMIGPYGFEFKGGKVIKKDGTPEAGAAREPAAAVDTTNGHGEPVKSPKKKAPANGKNRTVTPKKRKIEVVKEEDEGDDGMDADAA